MISFTVAKVNFRSTFNIQHCEERHRKVLLTAIFLEWSHFRFHPQNKRRVENLLEKKH